VVYTGICLVVLVPIIYISYYGDSCDIFQNCKADFCLDPDTQEETVCSAIADLVELCLQHMQVPEWRSDSLCPGRWSLCSCFYFTDL